MISVIEKYLLRENNIVFIWLTPGNGELEEQSKANLEDKCPQLSSKTVSEVLSSGFLPGDTVFINWEKVVKKGNKAITDYERKNLHDRIAEAHRSGLRFVIIIDEEHSNDTSKAQNIIESFAAIKQIRMSATAKLRSGSEYYEIEEKEVIKAGIITKAIVINEGIKNYKIKDLSEYEVLIDLALEKRSEVRNNYNLINKKINPLVVIQFPSSSDALIVSVEEYLNKKGINYSNSLLAKWMTGDKDKINLKKEDSWDIADINARPIVLLMKQAISTGWDAPRAKILVKLRENMDEDFEIQTLGRIRRMPERIHYGNDLLDCCYLFTLDTKYVESVKQSTDTIFEIKKILLKDKCKNFTLVKESKNQNNGVINTKIAYKAILKYYFDQYSISSKPKDNISIISSKGYVVSDKIINRSKYGIFNTLKEIKNDELHTVNFEFSVNTHKYGFTLMNTVNHIANTCQIDTTNMSTMLKLMFLKDFGTPDKKILSLNKNEYYAFIINNEDKLKEDLKSANSQLAKQMSLQLQAVTKQFNIPEVEYIKFDPYTRAIEELESSAYENYTEQTLVDGLRSNSEKLFERYCENNKKIDWVYKNGDSGQQYFSIVYYNSFGKQILFYPDYILKLKNGETYIIETKGGEYSDGTSKNIDTNVLNKFEAFKLYAKNNNIKWSFVRDLEQKLYFNNTEYVDSLSDKKRWKSIEELFKQ